MAIEDENENTGGASGSWIGKGTGSGATPAGQRGQNQSGTSGASGGEHIDQSHSGSGGEGSLGSGLTGSETSDTSGSAIGGGGAGTGMGSSAMGGTMAHDETEQREGSAFQDWDTSANPMIASNRVEGTAVYSTSRERLGTIQHIMIDKLSGQSEFAVMSFGGFLGIGSDYYPIPWNKLTYDTEAGGYVVDLTAEQLNGAPKYAADEEPDYGSDYSGQIGRHYGM